jgi:hypothetical protein
MTFYPSEEAYRNASIVSRKFRANGVMIIRGCAGFSCIVSRLKPPSAEIKRPTGAYPGHFLHIEGVVHKAKTTKHPRFDGVAGRHDPHFGILLSSPVSDFPTAEFVKHTCDKTKMILA